MRNDEWKNHASDNNNNSYNNIDRKQQTEYYCVQHHFFQDSEPHGWYNAMIFAIVVVLYYNIM